MLRNKSKIKIKSAKMLRNAALTVCIAALCLCSSGCMPYKELKEESIVEGVAIDTDGGSGYLVTFQIFKPQSGGSENKKSAGEVIIHQSTGASIFDAVRNSTLLVGRKLYFSNNRAYIISADACKNNFSRILDFMERNQQIKPTEHIFISRGKASDLLTYKRNDEYVPAVNIEMMAQNYFETSKITNAQLFDVFCQTATGYTDPALAAIDMGKDDTDQPVLKMDGTAVFHGDRLAGYLDDEETRGMLWVSGKVNSGVIILPLSQGGTASMEILENKTSVDVNKSNGKPKVDIKIHFATNITEIQSKAVTTVDEKLLTELKDLQTQQVKNEAQLAVDKALKQYGADIFGFGMKIYQQQPELWRQLEKNWSGNSKDLEVNISVNSVVRHTGLISK